jgi:hypothetical protein
MLPIQYYVAAKRREESSASMVLDNRREENLPGAPMVVIMVASFLVFAFLVGVLAYNLR